MPEVPYLEAAAEVARGRATPELLSEIQKGIENQGHWQVTEEWRISTEMTKRIEAVEAHGKRWFEVSVSCATDMSCEAPTLERAVEYLYVFERLTMDLFWTLGWSSWAAKGRLDPLPGELRA